MSDNTIDRCAAVAKVAWDAGSPIAGQNASAWTEVAQVAIRRWRSSGRRLSETATNEQRVEDLAKGLRDRLNPNPELVGAEMEDYRWLASQLAKALAE